MPDPSTGVEGVTSAELSEDLWLGGQLTLLQPKCGHRVGTDAALLVAATSDVGQGRIVDVGAGVGAVGLALAKRLPLASVDLVEIDPDLAALAGSNAQRNGLAEQIRVVRLNALSSSKRREAGLTERARCVVTNPPFFDTQAVRASPNRSKARAHVLADAGLADWIEASLAMLAPRGRFVMIHRPNALAMILASIGGRLGGLVLLPVHPAVGASAHRLLVSGVKGSKAPLRLAPALVLHGPDGRMTAEADAIHRGDRLIDWGA
jgi:tRNA1(Val) A37 N6-methylase TrmN6